MNTTTIAVDLAKNVFEIAVSRQPGKIVERHRVSRAKFLPFFAEYEPSMVLLEACGTAHYWARELERLEHCPVLVSPQHVRPYVQGNKTDRNDAKGLLEASRNEEIRPVPVKSEAQQNLGALHRLRSQWMATRTSRLNLLRGLLREIGLFIPVGACHVVPRVRAWLSDGEVPEILREALGEVCDEIRELEQRIKRAELQLKSVARQTPLVKRLMTIPGIGLLSSTALSAFIGDFHRFPSGRHLASFLGLTPQEYSSGQRRRLGRISKRGDAYLRMLLIHGARSVLRTAKRYPDDPLRGWALHIRAQRGYNKAAVALANKLARIVWVVACKDTEY